MLQGLAGILRDLVLTAAAPDRPELTGVSPQFRDQLPDLARALGRPRLLQWQNQLRGAEQQLRQSVQPRLWLEVLLLGLLAEPASSKEPVIAAPATRPVAAAISPPPPTSPPAASPELPSVSPPAPPEPAPVGANLPELWQQILGSLELPSTRMLLSQQAQLVRLDANRAVVQVAGNWMGMVQSRASLLEKAVAAALGGNRQLVLEAGGSTMTAPVVAAPPAPVVTQPTGPAPTPAPPSRPAPEPTVSVKPAAPPQPTSSPAGPTTTAQTPPERPSGLDRNARQLADFFNGQVLDIEQPVDNPQA